MVKKQFLLAILGLLAIPACKRSEKSTTSVDVGKRQVYEKTGEKSVFDEDVEAFVLEEEQNPFAAPKSGQSVRLVADESAWKQEREGEFETVYYDYDKASIRPDQKAVIERNVKKMHQAARVGRVIVCEGHACTSGGSAPYNIALSHKRAQGAADYIISRGVPREQVEVVGRGSEMPVVTGGDREAQSPNRRVEFYLAKESTTTA